MAKEGAFALARPALVAAVLFAAAPVRAEPDDPARVAQPPLRVFRDRDGLPQNTPMALAMDGHGVLWIGTQDGLASFDGHAFTTVNLPKHEVSNFLRTIYVDGQGAVWCGRQDGGLARFFGGTWTRFDATSGLPADRVDAIAESDVDGLGRVLWVATPRGLARREGGGWRVFGTDDGLPSPAVRVLLEATDDDAPSRKTLYAGTSRGLARFVAGRFERLSGAPDGAITALLETAPGTAARALWVGTRDGGVQRRMNGAWQTFGVAQGLPEHNVTALVETTATGHDTTTLWVGTDNGLAHAELPRTPGRALADAPVFTPMETEGVLPSSTAWSFLAAPRSGPTHTLWIGVDGGLARLRVGGWRSFTAREAASSAYAILVADDGALWIGTRGNGLLRLAGGRFERIGRDAGLPDATVFALEEIVEDDGKRALWVGTQGGGLVRYANGVFSKPLFANANVRKFRKSMGSDGKAVLYAATGSNGILRYAHGAFTAIDTHDGMPTDATFDVAETHGDDGRVVLWMGTQGSGIVRRDRRVYTVFDKRTSALASDSVTALHVSRDAAGHETLWAGTEGGGVSTLDPLLATPTLTTYTEETRPALPNGTVYQVQEDRQGRIYLFTNKGIARLTKRQPTGDDPSPYAVRTYTTEDGLPSNELNGGASYRDARGRIWAGTVSGVAFFDPDEEVPDEPLPRLRLDTSRVLRTGAPLVPSTSLAWDESSVTFEATLVRLFRGAETRYRSQLVGLDPAPSGWTLDPKREYTTLPEGAYVFRAWGRDFDGRETAAEEIAFRVRPAPWRTLWAYGLYAFVTGALAYGFVRYRGYALEERNRTLEAKIGERTVELGRKVTELAASEERARDAELVARRADGAKTMFLSTMSHELRTPLNAILGFAQLLTRDRTLADGARDDVEVIKRSGEHLLGLINDVLSMAKIEAGMIDLDVRAFRLGDLVRDAAKMIEPRARGKGLRFVVDSARLGADAVVRGDEGKLRQVLLNLLGNAVKFTRAGAVTLRAGFDASSKRAFFEVEDTGAGIATEELTALFAPFVQSAAGRGRQDGTGLGLVISRSYAQRMGGDVTATSTLGVGTTMRCEVPLEPVAEAEADAAASPASRRVTGLVPGLGPYRILVAEDTAENRALLVRLLTRIDGLDVREATRDDEAIALWETFLPDLVFLDMRASDAGGGRPHASGARTMNGRQITRTIRSRESPRRTKIVALSANTFEHERAALLEIGCDALVAKPYRESAIFEALEAQLGARFVRDADSSVSLAHQRVRGDVASRERISQLPAELRTRLLDAASAGDIGRARSAVIAIGKVDEELGQSLGSFIDAFLLEQIEERMKGDGGDGTSGTACS